MAPALFSPKSSDRTTTTSLADITVWHKGIPIYLFETLILTPGLKHPNGVIRAVYSQRKCVQGTGNKQCQLGCKLYISFSPLERVPVVPAVNNWLHLVKHEVKHVQRVCSVHPDVSVE